jgi:hypothetical protein
MFRPDISIQDDPKWIKMAMALSNNRVEFSKDIIKLMISPIVYVVIGDKSILYIGMSSKGIGRVLDRKHHALTLGVWQQAESIQVFGVDSESAARTLETKLIQEFNPRHNQRQALRVGRRGCIDVTDVLDKLGA